MFSKILDASISTWLDKYDYETRKEFTESIGKLFEDNGIITLMDFKNNKKKAFDVLKSAKNMNPVVKTMTGDLLKIVARLTIESRN